MSWSRINRNDERPGIKTRGKKKTESCEEGVDRGCRTKAIKYQEII